MCRWVQNRMPAFLSGELDALQSDWVRRHIRRCHVCQKALKVLKTMQDVVAQALSTDEKAPETLEARVLSAIDGLPPPPEPPPRRAGLRFWRR